MEKYIYDENNGLWYELQGDYYIPCLKLPDEEQVEIGIWGQRHLEYIKHHRKGFYTALALDCKVNRYLAEINKRAEEMFDTLIEQFPVTFVNEDGTILDVQYVDKGGNAVEPIAAGRISTPTKESTVSHDFAFAEWDSGFTGIFAARTITATYTSSLREYTVKYVSKGTTLQETKGLYGQNILYTGDIPTYTLEESAYVYHLFNRWDKSGFIDGNKTINAVFDRCEYNEGYFNGKNISDLSPVEIYALTILGRDLLESVIEDYDSYSFTFGQDYEFDDIESELIISDKTSFNGTNQVDTGIQLFDVDKDFVLAIDYKFSTGATADSVLAQCYQSNGSNGFQLRYNNGVSLKWGTTASNIASINNREMIVIRHKKGDKNLTIYNSNLSGAAVSTVEIQGSKEFTASSTFLSERTTFNLGNETYSPRNANNIYANQNITMLAAIAYSDNIYAMKTHLFLGTEMLANLSKKIGVKTPIKNIASSALGTSEINIIDYSNAFITLANEGKHEEPHLIEKITDDKGNILYEYKYKNEYILNNDYIYILNNFKTLQKNIFVELIQCFH